MSLRDRILLKLLSLDVYVWLEDAVLLYEDELEDTRFWSKKYKEYSECFLSLREGE